LIYPVDGLDVRPDSNVGVYCYSTRDFFLPGCRVLLYSSLLPCPPRRARAFCPLLLARLLPRQWPRFLHLRPAINHRVRHGQTSHPHPPVPRLAIASSSSSSSVQYPLALWACLLEVCCFCAHSSTCFNNSLLRLGRRRREQDKPWHCADRAGSSEEGGVRCRQGTVLTGSPSLSIGRVPLSPAAAPATHRRPSPASSSRFLP
jgi:hypothetical protein